VCSDCRLAICGETARTTHCSRASATTRKGRPRFEPSLSSRSAFVAEVQSTNLRHGHDWPYFWRLNESRHGRVLLQREMRSRSVIVIEIRIENSTQRGFMEHDHMIEALAPNGTNHPLLQRRKPICAASSDASRLTSSYRARTRRRLPEQFETSPMPPNQGLRFDDDQPHASTTFRTRYVIRQGCD
jgi:hypothetical protein